MSQIQAADVLDARDMLCPMPVVKAATAIKKVEPGQVLKILATDRGAIADFPAWAEDTGNTLLEWHQDDDGVLVFYIRRGKED